MNFDENDVSIGRFISILYRYAQVYISKQLRPYNIGSGQYSILLILAKKKGAIQENLASELQLDKANVARAVTRLEREGYVYREADKEDKRTYHIYLTDKGHRVVPIVREVLSDWNKQVSLGLDKNEELIVANILHKMAANVCVNRREES